MKALIQKLSVFLLRPTDSFQKQVSQTKEGGTIPLNLLECQGGKPVICSTLYCTFYYHEVLCINEPMYKSIIGLVSNVCFYLCNGSFKKGFWRRPVLAFGFMFIINFYKTKVPVLQTNLIVLERILVVSKIVTKLLKIFKHFIHFLYLMRPILMINSSCDKTESDKKSYWELLYTSKISNSQSTDK